MVEESLPVSEKLKVLDSVTIYKTEKWWSAVTLIDSFGRKQISLYVWIKRGDRWKRNQKFTIHSRDEWRKVKEGIEKFISDLER